ncbi:hypothetical protein ACNSPG_17695 [Brucella pituitosa]|uniref:hypothetical protein n=1 Tax=Brucella TaxID=234 RepID=UPI000466F37E|nr:hypothetical protein [Brucella rhizosphaerae]
MSPTSFNDQEQAPYDATVPAQSGRQAIMSFRPDGSLMNLAQPTEADVHWQTLGNALAKIARFNGIYSCLAYSVAQHSVMGADALINETGDPVLAGYFLLHDAHEAWIGDQSRPTTELLADALFRMHSLPVHWVHKAVNEIKARLDQPIYHKAGLTPVLPQIVRDMDERMLQAETLALFGPTGYRNLAGRKMPIPKLTGAIKPWGALKAEEQWLERLSRYLGIDWRAA